MLSKRYKSTEVNSRTWLHVPLGTHWSTRSDTYQVVEIKTETSSKLYTPFLIRLNLRYGIIIFHGGSIFVVFVDTINNEFTYPTNNDIL